ncbi:MAG: hypothetical protein HY366_01670 [Candidatus Aenigmarchaeota archaeon]|nr:hypothetical protein [Candidatus Aenigmarchaeota archaeon]
MNTPALMLAALVIVSGCVSFGGALSAFSLTPTKKVSLVEELRITGSAAPNELLEHKKTTLSFELTNAGNTTLQNAALNLTDTCVLDPLNAEDVYTELGSIRQGEIKGLDIDLQAQGTNLTQDCTVRYAASYESAATLISDVVVVSEDELTRLNKQGASPDLRIFETATAGPVEISFRVSKPQPIPVDTTFLVYIQLADKGAGNAEPIEVGALTMSYPSTVELDAAGCDDLSATPDGLLANGRDVKFFNHESKTITCKFRTVSGGVVNEVGQFRADVAYKYILRNSIAVKVKPA